jgi:hypothetical protein
MGGRFFFGGRAVDKNIHLGVRRSMEELDVDKGTAESSNHNKMESKGNNVLGTVSLLLRQKEETDNGDDYKRNCNIEKIGILDFNIVHTCKGSNLR